VTGSLYIAWRYLAYHRIKTALLILSVALIVFIPSGLRVLVRQSAQQLTARADSTPLVVGAKGSPLELILNTLYFEHDSPQTIPHRQAVRIADTHLARPIPMYVRFRSRKHPIVGTTLDYFSFRGLRVASGRNMAVLGECVLGSRVARALGVSPGGHVVSSPENVFDLAGVYPLKMRVAGVLAPTHTPDDLAIFVDVKTAWIIEGLCHGHQDLARPDASSAVLRREGSNIIGNASVRQYTEITAENVGDFHFHGDTNEFPITAVIAVPNGHKSAALLRGRYQGEGEPCQIARPTDVMDDLLATVFTVQGFVVTAMIVVGLAALVSMALVFMLSIRLRRREIETMIKIGGARNCIAAILAMEIVLVLATGVLCAGGLTALTGRFGPDIIRAVFL
jgi:putative ABC transport system permease protein